MNIIAKKSYVSNTKGWCYWTNYVCKPELKRKKKVLLGAVRTLLSWSKIQVLAKEELQKLVLK